MVACRVLLLMVMLLFESSTNTPISSWLLTATQWSTTIGFVGVPLPVTCTAV